MLTVKLPSLLINPFVPSNGSTSQYGLFGLGSSGSYVSSDTTGISGVIKSDGKIQNKIKIDQEKIIMERVNLAESGSFYTKFGDIFAIICFLITSIFTLYSCKERFL